MPVSSKYSEGYVLEYADKGKYQLGVILGVDPKSERLKLLSQTGREVTLNPKQITHLFEIRQEIRLPVQNILNALQAFSSKADYLASQCDIQELWTMFQDEGMREVALNDVVELTFSDPKAAEYLAIIRLFRNDHVFFKTLTHTEFQVRDTIQVQEIQRQDRFKENILKAQNVFAENAARILALPEAQRTEAMGKLLENRDEAQPWRIIEEYALNGTEHPSKKDAERFLDALQTTTNIGFSGTSNIKAQNFLRQCGYWSKSTNVFLLKHKIPQAFDSDLLAAAQALCNPSHTWDDREDLTPLNAFTIDDEETRDIDDGLSIETLPNGNICISVHIAAPQAMLPFISPLEREARRRATSVYLPDQRIPMFPKLLSEDAFSLVANKIRPAVTFRAILDEEYRILSTKIQLSRVCIKHRLTYEEADQLLEFGSDQLSEDLRELQMVMEVLQLNRQHNGAIDVDIPDIKISVDPLSRHVKVQPIDSDSLSRTMVSECMILANVMAADFCYQNGLPVLYRTQEEPHNMPTESELDALPSDIMRSFAIRRCMMPASSSMIPSKHAALGVQRYIQATSPIRRYGDLFAHYQMEYFIKNNTVFIEENEASDRLNAAEYAANEVKMASRETCHHELLRYLKQEMGTPQEAVIVQYNSDKGDQASVYLTLTQLRGTVSTRKRLPVGTLCMVQAESVHPEEDAFILKFISAVE